ncbi:MAG: GTP 3',8-cyclase MoaA [Pseudomonadota bacterium]|nr:GTP 3',8-cyclase MoaA [Pseudomonadota bacterium]
MNAPLPVNTLHPQLADARGRIKRKLRLSLTDRCNFRCHYCMPEHPKWLPKPEILNRAEMLQLVRLFVTELGVRELRLTGGEPLLRKDVVELVADFDTLRADGLERIAMTSNASRLVQLAQPLADAGLDDLNISIDAIRADRFRELTRADIGPVLAGIDAARAAGIPVKLNCVAIRDYNDDELLPLARWSMEQDLPLRFIEFMPLDGRGDWRAERVISEAEILERLARHHRIERLPRTHEPATYYRLDDRHTIGIISTVTNPFCTSCDRVRLSSTGGLYNCLFSPTALDLREPLRAGADDDAMLASIRGHVWNKEAGYAEKPGYVERPITMHHLGG